MATASASPSPAARRRSHQREETRRAILDATESLLVERGYDAFTMRRLASRCGFTAPTIYHYFGDKLGLFDALIEERVRRLLTHLRRVRRHDDPVENVRALAAAFARFGLQNPSHYRLLSAPRPEDAPQTRAGEQVRALFEEPLRELERAGRLRGDPEAVKQSLWVLVHGLVSVHVTRPQEGWSKGLLDTALDGLLRGLVAPAPGDSAS